MPRSADHQGLAGSETGAANLIGGARVAKIDDHLARVDLLRQIISLIEPRYDNGVRCFRRGGDRLSHAAFRSDEENANAFHV